MENEGDGMKKVIVITSIIVSVFILALIVLIIIQYNMDNLTPNEPLIPIFIEPSDYLEALSMNDILELNDGEVGRVRGVNGGSGAILEIRGIFSTETILSPKDAVLALTSVRDIMNIKNFSFTATYSEIYSTDSRNSFELIQVHEGVEVLNGGFRVHATAEEGVPIFFVGNYYDVGNINTTPRISARRARRAFKLEEDVFVVETKLIIYEVDNGDLRLCWHFLDSTYFRFFVVDANNGKLIAERLMHS